MFNLSGSEIVVILLLALVVLGPEKLPDALRRAGRTYAELKKMGNSFQAEMQERARRADEGDARDGRPAAQGGRLLRRTATPTPRPSGRRRPTPTTPAGQAPPCGRARRAEDTGAATSDLVDRTLDAAARRRLPDVDGDRDGRRRVDRTPQ